MRRSQREVAVRQTTESRIAVFEIQRSTERLTPLLYKELRENINVYCEALEQPNLATNRDLLKNLIERYERFTKHWEQVHQKLSSHSMLLINMTAYQVFLTEMLLYEYTSSKPYDISDWVLSGAAIIERHRAAMDDDATDVPVDDDASDVPVDDDASDVSTLVYETDGSTHEDDHSDTEEAYQRLFVRPVEELTLDVAHVENRLCIAVAEQEKQCSGGHVQNLIQQCDWQKLAGTILKDREIALALSSYKSLWAVKLDYDAYGMILKGIDNMEATYYTNLSSPVLYRTSKYARDLSVGRSSNSPKTSTPSWGWSWLNYLILLPLSGIRILGLGSVLKSRTHLESTSPSETDTRGLSSDEDEA